MRINLFEVTFLEISFFSVKRLNVLIQSSQGYGIFIVYKGVVPVSYFILGAAEWTTYEEIQSFINFKGVDFYLFICKIVDKASNKNLSIGLRKKKSLLIPIKDTNRVYEKELPLYDIDAAWRSLSSDDRDEISK